MLTVYFPFIGIPFECIVRVLSILCFALCVYCEVWLDVCDVHVKMKLFALCTSVLCSPSYVHGVYVKSGKIKKQARERETNRAKESLSGISVFVLEIERIVFFF